MHEAYVLKISEEGIQNSERFVWVINLHIKSEIL